MRARQNGFVLLPIALMIGMLAVVALLVTHDSAMSTELLQSSVDADTADYVADAGLEHARWRLSTSGCSGDIALPSTALGVHTYSASVQAGGSTSATSFSADRDSFIREDDVTKNEGTKDDMHIRSETGRLEQALVHFDVTSIAPGTRIQSATLWLHIDGSNAHPEGPVTVHPILADWDETAVTWENFAGQYDGAPLSSIPTQPTGDVWVQVNVTAQVQAWVNGEPNFGLLLAASADGIHAHYTTREGPADERPRIDVVTGGGVTSPATIQATAVLANGTTRSTSRSDVTNYQPGSTVTLPEGSTGKDTTLSELNPGTEYGNDDSVWVANRSGDIANALFQFDIRGVPPGARIESAVLSLYRHSGSGSDVPIAAYRVTADWSESRANWTRRQFFSNWGTAGGDYDPRVFATTEVGPTNNARYEWDLTELVQGWVAGTWGNDGVLLHTDQAGTVGESFNTSDHSDSTRHPRLLVSYACECGVACLAPLASGTDIMMVVRSAFSPDPSDQFKRAVFESWGYDVNYVDDGTTGFFWDLAINAADVVYVSGTADPAQVGTRLTSETIGIVSEAGALHDELEIAAGAAAPVGSSIQINDAAHPITYPFLAGPRTLYAHAMQGTAASGGVAPGALSLASWGSAGALIALDRGAETTSGAAAAERRVLLPVGGGEAIDWSHLTTDAWVMIHRALKWAAREAGPTIPGPEIWLSTRNDVSNSDAPGLDQWSAGEGIAFSEPDLILEPGTTEGTFSSLFDLDDFAGNAEIDALHRVETNVTVGRSNSFELFPGDLLLSTGASETLSSSNALSVADEDVFVFRPDTEGNYSSGTFHFLLDGSMLTSNDTTGISLVEKATTVGNVTLERGSFLMATTDDRENLMSFAPSSVGFERTSGTYRELFDGSDLGLESQIRGVDVAEDPIAMGGHTIPTGTIALAMESDDGSVGANGIAIDAADVFYLTVKQAGSSAEGEATLLFEGSDVRLTNAEENLDGVSFARSVTPDPVKLPVAHWKLDDGSGSTAVDSVGGHDGTLENGPTWTTEGQLDGALEFDGSNDRIVAPDDDALDITESLTMMAWIRNDEPGIAGAHRILSKEPSGSNSGYWMGLQNAMFFVGIGGSFFSPGDSLTAGRWHHLAATFDATAGEVRIYIDGAERLVQSTSATLTANAGPVIIGGNWESYKHFHGALDDVRIYDEALSGEEIAEIGTPTGGGGGGGGGGAYVETFQSWVPQFHDTWETVDLAPYGVPADAVVEIAVRNDDTAHVRWGGVRAVGSSLERRLDLHEAESGGLDVVVMHAQADSSSRIETYSDNPTDITFALLGYWTGATYEERFTAFQAGGSGSWRERDLGPFGVAADQVAEISISNASNSREYLGGARSTSSTLDRRLDLHEAEAGGVDAASLMVTASSSANATIEVYAESNSNLEFHLLGYWSTPPGRYVEALAQLGQPSASGNWVDLDLSGDGVPARAVAQIAVANEDTSREAELGLRANDGAGPERRVDLQEAESGGDNLATFHVPTDGASTVEWYDEDRSRNHEFILLGWWEQ